MIGKLQGYLRKRKLSIFKPFAQNIGATLKLTICGYDFDTAQTLYQIFYDVPEVEVVEGNILQSDAVTA